MDIDRLVQMANDIGNYFASDPDRDAAIAGMVNHLQRFWAPRMRHRIVEHLHAGGGQLNALAHAAVAQLAAERDSS